MKKKCTVILTALLLTVCIGWTQPAEAADIQVEINGQTITFDQPPIITSDRVMVPMRALAEALGAEVGWDGERRMMTSVRGEDTLYLGIGDFVMWHNDEAIVLEAAPMIVNGRTLAPIRAVSEGYGASVSWDYAAQKVTVIEDVYYARQVFDLTNQERMKAGLPVFEWSDALAEVVQAHCVDMAERGYFDHVDLDGRSPFDRMDNAGISYSWAAENLAMRYPTPAAVVAGWMDSPGHRANILNEHLEKLGVGYYDGYWGQLFSD